MGGGSWSASSWGTHVTRTRLDSATKGTDVFKSSKAKKEFLPMNVTRESCDSAEHPSSTPIILCLDVTGSMSHILTVMAKKLGMVMEEIYKRNPVSDPQVLFAGVGDSVYDESPLQVTQFESDIRIAEQMNEIWFERGGGGNRFESYPLIWYFANYHTKCDNYLKRNKKGFIFSFGDDGYPSKLTKSEIKEIFGDDLQGDIDVKELLSAVNKQYEVYHFCMAQGGSHRDEDYHNWQEILGEHAILVRDYDKIPEMIVSLLEAHAGKETTEIIDSWDGSTAVAVKEMLNNITAFNGSAESSELVEF